MQMKCPQCGNVTFCGSPVTTEDAVNLSSESSNKISTKKSALKKALLIIVGLFVLFICFLYILGSQSRSGFIIESTNTTSGCAFNLTLDELIANYNSNVGKITDGNNQVVSKDSFDTIQLDLFEAMKLEKDDFIAEPLADGSTVYYTNPDGTGHQFAVAVDSNGHVYSASSSFPMDSDASFTVYHTLRAEWLRAAAYPIVDFTKITAVSLQVSEQAAQDGAMETNNGFFSETINNECEIMQVYNWEENYVNNGVLAIKK